MMRGHRLNLRQNQSLVMTPQLLQAIKLLQMSNMELSNFIETQIEQNPLLEFENAESGYDVEALNRKEAGHTVSNDVLNADNRTTVKDGLFASDPTQNVL